MARLMELEQELARVGAQSPGVTGAESRAGDVESHGMRATVEAGMNTNVGAEEDGLAVAAEMDEDGELDQAQQNKRERKKRKRKRRKIQKEKEESRSWMLPQHEHEQDHDSGGDDGEEAALLALLAGQDSVAALDPSSTGHRAVGDEMTNFPSPPQQQQRDNRDNDKRGKKRKKREKREKRGKSARAQQSRDMKRKKANKKQKQEEGTSMNKHSRRTTTQRAKKHDTNRYTMVHELD